MAVPSISYLEQIGDFCVTYGPWAVAIWFALFILKIMRDHKKERREWEKKRSEEREFTINRFQDYHEEIVALAKNFAKSQTEMASKMLSNNKEIKILREAMEQFFTLIVDGIVKVKPAKVDKEVTQTISDFMPETYLDFCVTKREETQPIKKKHAKSTDTQEIRRPDPG